MNDRVHRVLDGDGTIEDLSPDERLLVQSLEATTSDVLRKIRSFEAPDLAQRVMASIEARSRSAAPVPTWWRRVLHWVWAPREFSFELRPAYGAFALVLLTVIGIARGLPAPAGPVASAPEVVPIFVQFRLEAPGATSVEVTGSFTNWASRVQLVETAEGSWSTLLRLEPGVHDYTFVVDGNVWVVDPTAPAVDDGFGGTKSRLFLTQPLENA